MTPARKAQTSRETRNYGPRHNRTTNGGGYPHRANRGTSRGGCANLADEVTAW